MFVLGISFLMILAVINLSDSTNAHCASVKEETVYTMNITENYNFARLYSLRFFRIRTALEGITENYFCFNIQRIFKFQATCA